MDLQIIISLISILFGGIAGYIVKYILDKKSESETRIYQDKREHYRTLVLCIKSLSEQKSENIKLFLFEYLFLWLYGSDSIIKSANKLLLDLKKNKNLKMKDKNILGELLVNMRLDIGLKSNLKLNDYIVF